AFLHSIAGNFTNNGTYTANASTVTFNGSALQTIGGSSATTFFNLAINNPTSISLDDGTNAQNKIVANTLTLSNGYVTTDATNLLVLNSTATATVANSIGGVPQSNSPYVNGPINKVGNTAFIFPVGFAPNGCVPIGIANSTGAVTDIFQAQYIHSSAITAFGNTYVSGLVHVSGCDYWQLNEVSGAAALDITGYWNTNNPCGFGNYVTSPVNVVLAHFDGGSVSWDSFGGTGVGTNATGSVTSPGVSTFGPFSLGTDLSGVNPLPIKLDYFTAVKENDYNTLTWKAECSSTSDSFVVERSSDGSSFTGIYGVKVYNPSDCSVPFTYNDHTSSGTKVYYRLRMTDVDGSISYSQIILILNNANDLQIFKMQPNPVQGSEAAWLSISSPYATTAEIVILSIEGREMQRQTVRVQAGATSINLQTDGLARGMYILRGIFSSGQSNTISFIKL
ncbi:MAG TPA: T9SS type A sorting domain-containing protein, partial [Puia sp.]|nr:T9SS type A sorting domain-containing protein [Puia sp.]